MGPRGHAGGRPGRPGWQQADLPPATDAAAWLAGRLPDGWFTGPAEITVDRDEITVVGALPAPDVDAGADDATRAATEAGRIARWREETRAERMAVADAAEARYGRKLAWGARVGDTVEVFTNLSVPVMTRLRQPERRVLDTLVEAGVARSRADALAWCVRLVGGNADSWLGDLRLAMEAVEKVRAEGPTA